MTPRNAPPRPRQVTLAAWLIMGGSAFVVLTVFERIAGLHTLESQESVRRFLSEPPGDGLGLGVQGVLDLLHTVALVAGGCATAAAILGYQVLQRSRGARLALTLLALPLFVTGLVTGGFMSSVVVAAAVMLWFQPARDWFDGVTRPSFPPATASDGPDGQTGPDGTASATDGPPAPVSPPAYPGFGTGPTQARSVLDGPVAPGAVVRPRAVVWACVLTWVFATVAVVVMASSIAVLAASPDLVFDELRRQNPELVQQGLSDDVLVRLTYVTGSVVIGWSLLAMVLAALVYRRVPKARIALIVSAAAAAGLCLVASLSQFLLLLPLAGCVVTVSLLVRPEVRAWFNPR